MVAPRARGNPAHRPRLSPATLLALRKLRHEKPIVHNVTNFVVMNFTANALLAVGASPIMAHAPEEIAEIVALARALVLNLGTLDRDWIRNMESALAAAESRGIPAVLDPVGAGASRLRTMTARTLLRTPAVKVLRGNASEILAVAGISARSSGSRPRAHMPSRGVDAASASAATISAAIQAARALSLRKSGTLVVCISGEVDWVVQGHRLSSVEGGHPWMSQVTGTGCAATALIGAFLAIEPDPFVATCHAMALMAAAGECAARQARGLGSFAVSFLDSLGASA